MATQLAAVRPALTRRTDRVLAGETPPRSRAHLANLVLEVIKVAGLLAVSVLVLR